MGMVLDILFGEYFHKIFRVLAGILGIVAFFFMFGSQLEFGFFPHGTCELPSSIEFFGVGNNTLSAKEAIIIAGGPGLDFKGIVIVFLAYIFGLIASVFSIVTVFIEGKIPNRLTMILFGAVPFVILIACGIIVYNADNIFLSINGLQRADNWHVYTTLRNAVAGWFFSIGGALIGVGYFLLFQHYRRDGDPFPY